MANIGKILKDEIDRLSRRNAASFATPLKKDIRLLKLHIRDMAVTLKALQAALRKGNTPLAVEEEGTPAKARAFTGKGIKSLRRKFKITQAQLARLANVSSQAVVTWEGKPGRIKLRHATYESLSAVRLMRKADVKAALASPAPRKKQ